MNLRSARRSRLFCAPDLAGYRSHLVALARDLDAATARDTFVLVPTRAAAGQLQRTFESELPAIAAAKAWPLVGSRGELYEHLRSRLAAPPRLLPDFEREAMLAAAAREAEDAGTPPPFHVRPALVAAMLALYDHTRRLDRSVGDFERLMAGELEPAAESDRGAAQLLEQTRFLAAAFRSYESRLAESGGDDEHTLRARVIADPGAAPLRHLVVAVFDRPFDADGYCPADVTLFTTIGGLDRLDLLSTGAVLDAGYADRLQLAFVELEAGESVTAAAPPFLVVPRPSVDANPVAFTYRDREDELEGVARRLKADRQAGRLCPLDRTALVVARPLPYLYLARDVFGGAGVPFQAVDTLPLAAEPYAAAVDVVLECAAANFTRGAITALLRSPHFRFEVDGVELDRAGVARLGFEMAEQGYLGGFQRLSSLADAVGADARAAARAAAAVAAELAPLLDTRPMADHADLLRAFLDRHDRPFDSRPSSDGRSLRASGEVHDRRRRARAAVVAALEGLAAAYRRHDPAAVGTVTELSAAVRRWLGAQTFAVPTGHRGVQVVDAAAARFGEFDDVQLMGMVEGEWPERPMRNVFYPRGLMAELEPSRPQRVTLDETRDHVRHGRAMFRDLAGLARVRTRVSTFALESEAVVEPSSFIEDLAGFGLPSEQSEADHEIRVFAYEALAEDPLAIGSPWAAARARNALRDRTRFQGEAGPWTLPRVSVSRLERYLKCPFQFYAANVLQIAEEREDDGARSPLERGRFLHELFETFFHEWQSRGRGRVTAREMAEARALFEDVAEPALRSLAPAEAALERARLFGSAVGSGIADRVFAMEAERGVEIRERLMEYELDGEFTFTGEDGAARPVRLRAKIDRVDILGDGTFRLIDYKTKYVPDRKTALQLPIYSACVRRALAQQRGRDIAPSEAMYLSFEGPQAVVALEERGKLFEELTEAASGRLVATLDDIAGGHYPPRPETRNLCTMCGFTAVCRTPGGLDESDDDDA